jgi:hypothetical protein
MRWMMMMMMMMMMMVMMMNIDANASKIRVAAAVNSLNEIPLQTPSECGVSSNCGIFVSLIPDLIAPVSI